MALECQHSTHKKLIWCWKHVKCCFHFYVTWCALMTGVGASQCPSSGSGDCDLPLEITNIEIFKCCKIIVPQPDVFTMKLWTPLNVMLLILTSMGHPIWLKWCQWLVWRVQWHTLTLVTYHGGTTEYMVTAVAFFRCLTASEHLTAGIGCSIEPDAIENWCISC